MSLLYLKWCRTWMMIQRYNRKYKIKIWSLLLKNHKYNNNHIEKVKYFLHIKIINQPNKLVYKYLNI